MKFSDGFEKVAIVGPIIDAAHLGIPSIVSYQIGKAQGLAEGEETDAPSTLGKVLKGAVLPGYIGYRFGLAAGHKASKHRAKKED